MKEKRHGVLNQFKNKNRESIRNNIDYSERCYVKSWKKIGEKTRERSFREGGRGDWGDREKQKGNGDSVSQSVAVVVGRITGFHVTGSSDVPLFLPCFFVRGGRETGGFS